MGNIEDHSPGLASLDHPLSRKRERGEINFVFSSFSPKAKRGWSSEARPGESTTRGFSHLKHYLYLPIN